MELIISGALGTMGRVVAQNAQTLGHTVVAGVDRERSDALPYPVYDHFDCCPRADVVIDFSHPSALPTLLEYATGKPIPVVIATTGMDDGDLQRIEKASAFTPVFFSFNMSLGVNLLAALARQAAAVLGEGFDVEIVEKHHNKKIDAPSGTAVMLQKAVAAGLPYKPDFVYERQSVRRRRDAHEIGVHSIRGGTIVGEHEVIFAGADELVTLSHSAHSKGIFAVGAVKAAEFLQKQGPGLYNMESIID